MLINSDGIVYDCYYSKLMIILIVTNNIRADVDNTTTGGNYFENLNNLHEKLFEKYLDENGLYLNGSQRFEVFKTFKTNLVLIDYLNSKYTTAKFGINKYTGISFDYFIQGYTGFNGTGLTDEGVIEFDPKFTGQVPIVMDWSNLLTPYEMSYCKNSYVYSALSKYNILYVLSNKIAYRFVRRTAAVTFTLLTNYIQRSLNVLRVV